MTREDAVAHARAAFPAIGVGARTFEAYLVERPSAPMTPSRVEELYVACGCALGDPTAIAALERVYFGPLESIAARLKTRGLRSEDLRQQVRERLLVSRPGALPRIATYTGEGELRGWLRAVTMRTALNMLEATARDKDRLDESVLFDLPDIADDPELGLMKRHYRAEFDAAVAVAFAALAPKERNLLRYAVVKKLTTEAIGVIYDVHRTTAMRWLDEAQRSFLREIRAAMMARLHVTRSELESILRLVRSRLELTLADHALATAS
jgi:RNA polymerase sigma-70 factor (ECF subfamily)